MKRVIALCTLMFGLLFGLVQPATAASGCGTLRFGATGQCVRMLQQELMQDGYQTRATGNFQKLTLAAVKKFQRDHGLTADGIVGPNTWRALGGSAAPAQSSGLSGVDSRTIAAAKRSGIAIDASKPDLKLRIVTCTNGACVVTHTGNARFGSSAKPTSDGAFAIYWKRDGQKCVSYASNGAPMPWCSFFNIGQAIHYSPNFARVGYNGASNGCINLDNLALARYIYEEVPIGTKVVVH